MRGIEFSDSPLEGGLRGGVNTVCFQKEGLNIRKETPPLAPLKGGISL
jgi:hypothetical protein